MNATITVSCPSCGRKFSPVEPMRVATTVHGRRCRNAECREQWNITVRPVRVAEHMRVDRVTLTFVPETTSHA